MGRVPPPTSEQKWMVKLLLFLAFLALIMGFLFGYFNPKAKADSVGHHKHHHVTHVHHPKQNPVKPNTDSNGFTPGQQFGVGFVVIAGGSIGVFLLYRRTYRHHMRHRRMNAKNKDVKAHKKAHDDKKAKAERKARILKGGKA